MSRTRMAIGGVAGLVIVGLLIVAPLGLKPYGIYILAVAQGSRAEAGPHR